MYRFRSIGNVSGLVDSADGSLDAKYEYGSFGEPLRVGGTAIADDNPFRFSTKYLDTESGLIYYGFRYYSPSLGRFLNRDPIGEEGGQNLYAFVQNDPVNGADYLGMETIIGECHDPKDPGCEDLEELDEYIVSEERLDDSLEHLYAALTSDISIPGSVTFIDRTGSYEIAIVDVGTSTDGWGKDGCEENEEGGKMEGK